MNMLSICYNSSVDISSEEIFSWLNTSFNANISSEEIFGWL